MGAILGQQHVDERMAELTTALGHHGEPAPAVIRPCARCGRHRGRGHKWCDACRPQVRKEYNEDYFRRKYKPKPRAEVSAARRAAVQSRWAKPATPRPDEDLACPMCLGAGELCTRCEQPPTLCDCGEPDLCRCGMCQGGGDRDW